MQTLTNGMYYKIGVTFARLRLPSNPVVAGIWRPPGIRWTKRLIHNRGRKKPNAWGIYEMHCNVWKWGAENTSIFPGEGWSQSQERNISFAAGRSGHTRNTIDPPVFSGNSAINVC